MDFIKNRGDGRVVEGARLESVSPVKGIKGSNPFLSAKCLNKKINLKGFKKIKECLICKHSKMHDLGKINNVNAHSDLRGLFRLIKCINCGHGCLNYMPNQNILDKLYESGSEYVLIKSNYDILIEKKFKKKYLKSVEPSYSHWVYKFAKKHNLKGFYFEIGPGNCILFKTFKESFFNCSAYEKQSWVKDQNIYHSIKDIKKNKMDLVVATDVLEHIANPLDFIKKFNFLFKKNTKLFISVPNMDSNFSKLFKNNWRMVVPIGHVNYFTKDSMKIFLKKNNFKIIKIDSFSEVKIYNLSRSILKFCIRIPLYLILLRFKKIKNNLYEILLNFIDLFNGDQMRVIAQKE